MIISLESGEDMSSGPKGETFPRGGRGVRTSTNKTLKRKVQGQSSHI